MLTTEEINLLIAVGLPLERQRTAAGPRWFVGSLGPFKSPEEALVVAVGWLIKNQSAPIDGDDDDDQPPEPFRELLG